MLSELELAGLGVIETAQISFPPGMTVISGETGAGKTMLLNALAWLVGARADSSLVRAERAQVSGVFTIPPAHQAAELAVASGAAVEDGELIAGRTITKAGRSSAYLGGARVPSATLAAATGQLVAVHGQSDQLRLRSAAEQLDLLDRFAGLDLAAYSQLYDAARAARQRLDQFETQDRQSAWEADSLRRSVAEIEAVAPQEGEEVDLPARIERLAHAEDLRAATAAAEAALAGGSEDSSLTGGADQLLDQAKRALERAAQADPSLAELATRAGELAYLASDLASDVAHYAAELEADPATMAALQERRSALNGLLRKYGATAKEVNQWAAEARERLDALDLSPAKRQAAEAEAAELAGQLAELADSLSATRTEAAGRLEVAVNRELAALGMTGARFEVALSRLAEPLGRGVDQVEFRFAAHGRVARPLAKGASGGELSRVMLALEVAALGEAPGADGLTLVFDEVDQGVGGAAALAVAERLARLARSHQVLAVTHLPQIAAAAGHHLVVTKHGNSTTITPVQGLEREKEVARMLAGVGESAAALTHAAELLGRDWVGQFSVS